MASTILMVLMFTPNGLGDAAFSAVFAVIYVAWSMSYTINDVGYWSMLPAISQDQKEREKVGAIARICSAIGAFTMVIAILAANEGGLAVPLMIGTNKDEASLFKFMKSPLIPITDDRIAQMFTDMAADNPALELPSTEQVRTAYEHARSRQAGLGIARDIGFRMPTLWVAEGHSTVADVWLYRFDHAAPFLRLIGLGATHATELPYLWGNLSIGPKDPTFRLGGRRAAEAISQRMQERWTAFAHGRTPDATGAPPGRPMTPSRARPSWSSVRTPW